MLDLEELIQEDERVSKEFVEIIERINNGDITTVEQLQLDPNIFNPSNQRLFLLSAQSMQDAPPRYNGNPAFTHPASSAYLLSLFMNRENINRDKAIGYLLPHDHLEDVAKYNPSIFQEIREHFGSEYKDELDAAVLLSIPERGIYPKIEQIKISLAVSHVAKLFQVQDYGNAAHAYALVGDAFDNQINIKFLDGRPSYNRNGVISRFIAQSMFLVQELRGIVPELVKPVEFYSEAMIKKYSIEPLVESNLGDLNEAKELYQTEPLLMKGIKNHLTKFAFET